MAVTPLRPETATGVESTGVEESGRRAVAELAVEVVPPALDGAARK